jgi:hypothetical protein
MSPKLFFLSLFVTLHLSVDAQTEIYQSSSTLLTRVKVMANGKEKKNAWAGGQNTPQFAVADMNKDGKNDLIIYERDRGVKVYINTGAVNAPIYTYAPEFEYKFPTVYNYIKLIDYNCDNVPDLFHFGTNGEGLVICDGFYDSNDILTFRPGREIRYYRQGQSSNTNINIQPTDIPSIEDIDHDGDLDFVTYMIGGSQIVAWKNTTIEDGLPCDSFRLKGLSTCWGKVTQGYPREHQLNIPGKCPPYRDDPSNRTNHGNNALCLLDIDGDDDFDFLDGNQEYSDIQLIINGKNDFNYPIDSMTAQDTLWQKDGHRLYMPSFPAAYWVDIDQDGDRDILISPKLTGTENFRCIALYENTGSSSAPNYVYRSDSFLIEDMIDLGTNTYPTVYDYDKDGLLDLLVGTLGRYNPINKTTLSRIAYYRNTGTATSPVFTLMDDNFLDLETLGLDGAALAIGDLDNDGMDELLIGRKNGNVAYFKNYAASATVQPDWRLWQRELGEFNKVIRANNFATPVIYDVDKDGVKDLICGSAIGYLYYYRNTATIPGEIKLVKQADSLGKLKIGPYQAQHFAAPFIGKIDNTGKEYLMVGAMDGSIQRWEGIDSGDPDKTYTRVDTFYSNIFIKGKNAAPVFADINNDDKYEVFIGNDLGGVNMYFQIWNVNVDDVAKQSTLSIYPNPATGVLNVGLNDKIIPAKSTVRIYSSVGQLMRNVTTQYHDNAWRIDVNALPVGMYLCSVYCEGKTYTARFSKTN